MYETIVEAPNIFEASSINFGFSSAAELIATLSAPEFRAFSISLIFLMPPPNVIGTKTSFVINSLQSQ